MTEKDITLIRNAQKIINQDNCFGILCCDCILYETTCTSSRTACASSSNLYIYKVLQEKYTKDEIMGVLL